MDDREELYWDCEGIPFDADWELRRFVSKQVETALIEAFDDELTVWLETDNGEPQFLVAGPQDPRKYDGLTDVLQKRFDLKEVLLSVIEMNPDGIDAVLDVLEHVARELREVASDYR